jgi:hypothetical protein
VRDECDEEPGADDGDDHSDADPAGEGRSDADGDPESGRRRRRPADDVAERCDETVEDHAGSEHEKRSRPGEPGEDLGDASKADG